MQVDIRSLLNQTRESTEIMRAMLGEQQLMRATLDKSMVKIGESVDKMTVVAERTGELVAKTEAFIASSTDAISKLDDAILSNADSVKKIVDAVGQMVIDNDTNIETLIHSIETITQASLTLAHVQTDGDRSKIDAAQIEAFRRVAANRPAMKMMREASRAHSRDQAEKRWKQQQQDKPDKPGKDDEGDKP